MMKLTLELIAAHADELGEFFPGIASFLLTPEERDRQGVSPPQVPTERGTCGAFVVWRAAELESWISWRVLNRSFFVPLQWQEQVDEAHSLLLPQKLQKLADHIKDSFAPPSRWTLAPAHVWNDVDLSSLRFSWDSAWAPLAAGLYLAIHGGAPRGDVFSTGSWQGRGISAVDKVGDKVKAAVDLMPRGSDGERRQLEFFVPHANINETERAAHGLPVLARELPPGQRDAAKSLQPLLARLAAPPPATASLDSKTAYANQPFIIADYGNRVRYYKEHLVQPLGEKLRSSVIDSIGQVDRLVVGVSKSPEIAELLLLAIRPFDCLFLCTSETEDYGKALSAAYCRTKSSRILAMTAGTEETACQTIADWLREGETPAVDITAGNKEMTAVLIASARRVGARTLYLRHKTTGTIPLYGTERLDDLTWVAQ